MEIKVFLIVGSGVFGASTALCLIKTAPDHRVILIDRKTFPDKSAASSDLNKIIRTEYDDPVYMRLALEAQKSWREDPLYVSFFHEATLVSLGNPDISRRIIKRYGEWGVEPEACMISVAEMKQRYKGLLDQTSLHSEREVYVNPRSGWANASLALADVVACAVQAGVEAVEATVTQILFDLAGNCTGVRTADGKDYIASDVILAAGIGIIELLANSVPDRSDFRVEGRLMGAAVVSAVAAPLPEQRVQLSSLPIFVHDVGEIFGEVLPLTADGYLKFASETSFRNTVYHERSDQTLSIPPYEIEDGAEVPVYLKNECLGIREGIFGQRGKELPLESYRICWYACLQLPPLTFHEYPQQLALMFNSHRDAHTADEDFIISPHSHCENLFFATTGSFHSWKFLPILGKLVSNMMNGTLDPDLAKRWAWDRDMPHIGRGSLWPKREWKDIVKWEPTVEPHE